MDLDSKLMSHGKRLGEMEAFVERMKALVTGAGDNVAKASDDLSGLMQFKADVEKALPNLPKILADAETVLADLKALRAAFAPTFEWVQKQVAAEEARKANRAAAIAAGELEEHPTQASRTQQAPEEPAKAAGTPSVGSGSADAPKNAVDQPGAQTA